MNAFLIVVLLSALAGERWRPLQRQGREHLWRNLLLSALTLAISAGFNLALVAALPRRGRCPTLLVVAALDFAAWLAHLSMHQSALLWRFCRVRPAGAR